MSVEEPIDLRGLTVAERYVDMGRSEQALAALDRLGPDVARSAPACSLRVSAHLIGEDYDAAAQAAREGLADHPQEAWLLYGLSVAEEERGDLAEAERAILAALGSDPDDALLLCQYADLVMRAGQHEKAERLLTRAGEAEPESIRVLQGRLQLAYLRYDTREADRLGRALLAAEPDDLQGHAMLGALALDGGRAREAAERFSVLARADPTDDRVADLARAARRESGLHRLPSRLVTRFGVAGTWVVGVGTIIALRAAGLETAAAVATVIWLAFVVMTWVFHES